MGEVRVTEEESGQSPLHKPIKIFGKDILEIQCFRKSIICGICTGIVGGLACFLCTSKALWSSHTGFFSLWVGALAYWIPCRYKYEKQLLEIELMKSKGSEVFLKDISKENKST